ncbi:Chitin synthase, class 3, partial [Podila epicladia]
MESAYQDLENPSVTYEEPHNRRQSGGLSLTIDTRRPNPNFRRQKSLVRPERERIDKNHPQYFYRNVTQNLDGSHIKVQASTTGNNPTGAPVGRTTGGVRRGKSVLGREPEKPGQMRNKSKSQPKRKTIADIKNLKNPLKKEKREWPSKWIIYYNAITCCFPAAILGKCGGMHTAEIQRAWREKIALVSLIVFMVGAVAFLTFGLQQALCQDEQSGKFVAGSRQQDVIVNGMGYYFNAQDSGNGEPVWMHPALNKNLSTENIDIMNDPESAAKGMDASFLFQDSASACEGLITRSAPTAPTDNQAQYIFPCVMRAIDGSTPPGTIPKIGPACHTPAADRESWNNLKSLYNAPAYYTWGNITNPDRNLFAYDGDVYDADILKWIKEGFAVDETIASLRNGTIPLRRDLSFLFVQKKMTNVGACLKQIARIGAMDSKTIGCMTSDVITYVSLVIILGVVFIKFFLAVFFGWFLSHRLGGFDNETYQDRMKRAEQIEAWSSDINRPAFATKRQTFFPTTSRFTPTTPNPGTSSGLGTPSLAPPNARPISTFNRPSSVLKPYTPPGSPGINPAFLSASSTSLNRGSYLNQNLGPNGTPPPSPPPLPNPMRPSSIASFGGPRNISRRSSTSSSTATQPTNCPMPVSPHVIPQPPVSFQPFNFPLIHTMSLVTCYSEGIDGLRTTLDSIATTDYPNSHKLIVVICDGMIIGAGNNMSTPDICLSMMQDDLVPRDDVIAHSYVAIADGTKRHNMAKVYAGFYKYDDETVPNKQLQKRVPMCVIVKVGGPTEQNLPKPVFEYYISHHMSKAFESMFGGVTCLPGCFCMYRIKAPKGPNGYWVPILANPDIVEHYSENVVDTLHKKNLLLLGEDRYLSTLMLRTFPKRKMMFVPQAICKTVVPDTFKILLSQRRRWINSTIHNLMELVLVRDLCGTFCFSMQFVIFMELVGTVVLPAAISFTIYL